MNESPIQEQSSSISENSYVISSSEPTLLQTFQEYNRLLKNRKNKKGKERERHDQKITEYKEKLEESLRKSDSIEKDLKEKERVIMEMKEVVDEREKQVEQLSKAIKELEEQLMINQQATPKPQRVIELAEHETGGSFNSSISIHSTPKSRLPKQMITYS